MKYTIELTDNQKKQMDFMLDMANKHMGFNRKLEMDIPIPMKESPAYKKGFEDGNNIADKDLKEIQDSTYDVAYNEALKDVDHAMTVLVYMTETEREEWFENYASVGEVVREFTIQRIMESTKAYEEKKKAEKIIKEGDIVKFNEKSHVYNIKKDREFLVLHVFKDRNLATILYDNGDTSCVELSLVDKTNRHIDEVSQLLNKLRGEEE